MQFRVYKSKKSYDELSQALLCSGLKVHLVCEEDDYVFYYVDSFECFKQNIFKMPVPSWVNLCIKKEGNPLVVVEFMRNLSDDVLRRIVDVLGLEGVTLQKKQLLEIYNDHMLRMLMAYFQTDDGKLLEVSSKNEADLLINTCELMALSFIPNNHDCSVIPIMVVRRDGLILTDVDFLSSIRLIYRILGFV